MIPTDVQLIHRPKRRQKLNLRYYQILKYYKHESLFVNCIHKSILFLFLQVYPSFWPDSTRSKKYGQVFTVEHVSHKHYPNIRTWVFRINKKVILKPQKRKNKGEFATSNIKDARCEYQCFHNHLYNH